MPRRRRLLILALAALIAAATLSGCGSTRSQNGVMIQKKGSV